jgi:signal transduction histidine kinase/DNA-binding response OmpR family regulator
VSTAGRANGRVADILVVDDNPNQLTALEVILADLGANVVCVNSGREALKQLLRQDFAAILLDVNMPTMDGFETAHLIRQRARSEHTPIIFITAFADETHIARGYSLGAVDYILTPVVPEVLRTKVSVFVELYRQAEEIRRQADSLRRRATQLHELTEASLAIHDASSIERMLGIVTERGRAMIGAHRAAARVRLDATRRYDVEARSPACDGATDAVAELDAMVDARAVTDPRPVWIARQPAAVPSGPPWLDGCVAVALVGRGGRPLGVLQVSGKSDGDFTAEDQAVLVQLGQMASIAIENTLYSEEREANRLKDEFLATVSHELRTPLTAMLSWLRLLQGGTLAPHEATHGLEVIDRNARAQAKLVDDLLDMSRIVNGKLRIEHEAVDLGTLVAGTIESARPAASSKGITLDATISGSAATVMGDAKRLEQVMGNLLSTAIKFTPREGRVAIELRDHEAHAEIRVRDTGRGINATFLPHVFDRFRQADTSTTRAHGGLGLGLAIVRHLVDLHGGEVRAESDGEERGATFIIRLPLASAAKAITAVGVAGNGASRDGVAPRHDAPTDDDVTQHASGGTDGTLAGVRVLVVEDDADGREAIAMLLTSAGADVVAVASASAALRAIADEAPDVLVSDIGLPIEDGYVLIRKVRALEAARGGAVPAIALTAYTRAHDRARALAAGYQAHVCKPVDPPELLGALSEFVSARRAHDSAP